MQSMKKVMSWKTISSSGVRFGSARMSLLITTTAPPPVIASGGGPDRGLGLLGGGPEGVDGPVGDPGRIGRDLGDPVAEVGVEEDRRDRQRDPLERDEQRGGDAFG